jgi:DNA-binding MurR/RpiR family transcriptional regulator
MSTATARNGYDSPKEPAAREEGMPEITTETELRELISRAAGDLPPQQRAIADYLLEHIQMVPFLSIPEFARRTGASEATIVRFAQRIGFSGFGELKMELVELLQNRLAEPVEEEYAEELHEDVLDSVAALEIRNIEKTVESTDRATFKRVAEELFASQYTYTFGMGVSAHLAELAAYTLTQIGLRSSCLSTRFTSPREQLVAVQPGDLVVVFSFPPYSRQTLHLISDADDRGAATVAICDRLTAPAAGLARWAFAVKSDNVMFTNAVAAVTVLFNALAAEIATRHREQALDAFAHINRVLGEASDVIPPDR